MTQKKLLEVQRAYASLTSLNELESMMKTIRPMVEDLSDSESEEDNSKRNVNSRYQVKFKDISDTRKYDEIKHALKEDRIEDQIIIKEKTNLSS